MTFDLIGHLYRQRAFSKATFGPGQRTQGVCDHIRKELAEVEEAHTMTKLSEWVDVVLLALDGAWREAEVQGLSLEEFTEKLSLKQTINENRDWPDWRTADPDKAIEHVRSS